MNNVVEILAKQAQEKTSDPPNKEIIAKTFPHQQWVPIKTRPINLTEIHIIPKEYLVRKVKAIGCSVGMSPDSTRLTHRATFFPALSIWDDELGIWKLRAVPLDSDKAVTWTFTDVFIYVQFLFVDESCLDAIVFA